MYKIGQTINPDLVDDASQWTIYIDLLGEWDGEMHQVMHYEVITVHASTLDECLLRVGAICKALNSAEYAESNARLKGLQDAVRHKDR